jgi:hypothetical protein
LSTAADALRLLHEPGSVFEIRALNPKAGRPRTMTGYFNDVAAAADAAKQLDGDFEGVYVTINPVVPALLARAANRMRESGRGESTADADVVCRRWLVLDFDPVRPAGVSALDEEKQCARALAGAVVKDLTARGWPEPVRADSGNGYHALYRIDLPNDDAARDLIKGVLATLAEWHNTDGAKVDQQMSNAARIVKAYGTLAAKGDSTTERPHRRSGIRHVPAPLDVVARELLEALVPPPRTHSRETRRDGGGTFSLVEWFARHGITPKNEWSKDGVDYYAVACPWGEGHGERDESTVMQFASGALAYKCHHASCAGRRWKDYRKHYEPNWSGNGNGRTEEGTDGDVGAGTKEVPRRQFPDPPHVAAYYGALGDLVRMVAPHSEADPVAVLAHALAYFGAIVGRTGHLVAEARRHHGNLFIGIVAATSKGRKGSAGAQVERVLRLVDEDFMRTQRTTGLSSGEGLIWAVRDEIRKKEPVREKGRVIDYQEVVTDPGVSDKRVIFVEEELGGMLSVMSRDGNSLSPTIRQAWDTGDLNTAVKNNPARATGALVSIVGHVTVSELRRNLDDTSKSNGFANRFIWLCARRSKALPFGGRLTDEALGPVVVRLRVAVDFARKLGEKRLDWSYEAAERWRAVYSALSEGRPGLLGSVTSRAEAQCTRLALIYALADCADEIRLPHLEAALALWIYSEASARFIFGEALGDPLADELLRLLRQAGREGMTRTAIREAFSRNRGSDEITRALNALAEAGLARMSQPDAEPGQRGRRPETWYAVDAINAVIPPEKGNTAFTASTAYPHEPHAGAPIDGDEEVYVP